MVSELGAVSFQVKYVKSYRQKASKSAEIAQDDNRGTEE
jgi:hypothetical protein